MRRHLLWAVIAVTLGTTGRAAEPAVQRYLEFRDGSVLRLPVVDQDWKITVLRPEGELESRTVRLSSLQTVKFTVERVLEKKRAVLAAVQKMGADDFSEREQAQEELLKMGPAIRPDLEVALGSFSDVEIQHRLKLILAQWNDGKTKSVAPALPFDQISMGENLLGDMGDASVIVQLDHGNRTLSRADLRSLSVTPPEAEPIEMPRSRVGGARRIEAKDFPPGCLEEGFETTPDGRKLTVGENIEKLFVRKGLVLSTSIKESHVSVNNFLVNGKSGGLSVATHQPLYHGEITIRFVQPGRENIPAGVHYFGCWMAVVMPKGTGLVAFDAQGREIGSIQTEHGPHEFMGIQSSVPMFSVRVVPNLEIDPDYTLDDFIYSMPQPADIRHAEKYIAYLNDGQRLLCREVECTREGIKLRRLPANLPDRTVPMGDLLRVATPTRGRPDLPIPSGVYAELRDGSVLFGTIPGDKPAGPVFTRRPQTLKEQENLVGLWKADVNRMAWPTKAPLAVAWDPEKNVWLKVTDVRLTDETVQWTAEGGKRQTSGYRNLPALLLGQPAEFSTDTWHVRTVLGEDIVLDGGASPVLSGLLSTELTSVWQGKPLTIPAADLVSISRVAKGP